jgi:RHS repeat-associated protein
VPLGENCSNCTEGIFFIHPQVLDGPGKNGFRYDGSAPGRMLYNRHRNYDPDKGRYLESDPIGLEGGVNTYSYVRSRITAYSDRLGLKDYLETEVRAILDQERADATASLALLNMLMNHLISRAPQ